MSKTMCNSCDQPLVEDKNGPAELFCPTCGFEVYDSPEDDAMLSVEPLGWSD